MLFHSLLWNSFFLFCFRFFFIHFLIHYFQCHFSVYVENGRSSAASTFSFNQATAGVWNIKVSQIECSSHSKAPADCDQYLTGVSGIATSYNWPNTQLQSTAYVYCFRREQGKWHFGMQSGYFLWFYESIRYARACPACPLAKSLISDNILF